jgi:peptidoglycan/xylan/chitin deacetylase (PgdA/CDA1 family)
MPIALVQTSPPPVAQAQPVASTALRARVALRQVRAGPVRRNILTVDLEDWGAAVIGPTAPLTERVVANTRRVLKLLDATDTRATFFVLGRVAEAFPDLVRDVATRGHEIASHGFAHELIFRAVSRGRPTKYRRARGDYRRTAARVSGAGVFDRPRLALGGPDPG